MPQKFVLSALSILIILACGQSLNKNTEPEIDGIKTSLVKESLGENQNGIFR